MATTTTTAAATTTTAAATTTTAAATTYTISAKAQTIANNVTLQRPAPGMGKAWRTAGYKAPSLRHQAITAIAAAANGQPFTAQQAMAALAGVPLGSGTPNSFVKAFIACGYLAPVQAPAKAKGAK